MKERSSNIELFRIVMMLLIVAHHYVVNTGIMEIMLEDATSWQSLFLYMFGMWGKIGINCFVMITGYFMCKSDITIRKFLKLLLEVLFYNIVCFAAFAIAGYQSYSLADIVKGIMPMRNMMNDFMGCFLVYYLLIPFLNKMLGALQRKEHRNLIVLSLEILMVWNHMPMVEYKTNYVIWFSVLHVIAAYLRFYEDELAKKYAWIHSHLGWVTLGFILLAMASVYVEILGFGKWCKYYFPYRWVMDCEALLAVPTSVLLFMWFKSLKVPQSKVINAIAGSTLAVLLIHANSGGMQRWLWHDTCHISEYVFSSWMPLHAVGSVVVIFVACVIVDQARIYIFEKPTFTIIDRVLAKYGIK